MYYFRQDVVDVFNQSAIARQVGLNVATVNRIFNGKQACSKTTAYCICKTINNNAEIEDYFKKKGE
jgi:DNA-binding XRE family transcriptional regulator